ncbi:MAG TPA: hypothetical protein ENG33_08975 [Chloroflexi bacterium]|nr:hypothetical protein [Chloroflexota bacterium]
MEQATRYLIVGTGRCGSSLLAAILAKAGANFDMPVQTKWDRRSGEYEHPMLLEARRWLVWADKIARSPLPSRLRNFCQRRAAQKLDELLRRATFLKSPELVRMVHIVAKLGYQPKIILSYRQFEGYSVSRHLKSGWGFSRLVEQYINVNSTALLQLYIFGGCTIGYEELVNKEETVWAEALEQLTGIKASHLLESRESLVKAVTPQWEFPVPNPEVMKVYKLLVQLKGLVIEPVSSSTLNERL